MKKKIRKPKIMRDQFGSIQSQIMTPPHYNVVAIAMEGGWFERGNRADLKDAKRLHKWLGRAIAYLEQK